MAINHLVVIEDPPADGPANMQRDLQLLGSLGDQVILRCYQWSPNWLSYGYSQNEAEAKMAYPEEGLNFVRRPTGGGLVDHREDFTYSLFIPKQHSFSLLSRTDCYRGVHELVQEALTLEDITSRIVSEEQGNDPSCFLHPVPGDVINPKTNQKIAGAAQRRTRTGLLHQGSILVPQMKPSSLVTAFESSRLGA